MASVALIFVTIGSVIICIAYVGLCWCAIWHCSLSRQRFMREVIKGDEHEKGKKLGSVSKAGKKL